MAYVWIITHGHDRDGGDVVDTFDGDASVEQALTVFDRYIREEVHNRHYNGLGSIITGFGGGDGGGYLFNDGHEWLALGRWPIRKLEN